MHGDADPATSKGRGASENDRSPAAPRASATVVLLRDAPAGVEVLLVRRHALSQVLGGAWVFPGGKADACDADLRILAAQGAVAFPGHAQHPVATMALPGPSFLVYRNERFEPADGFAALLG